MPLVGMSDEQIKSTQLNILGMARHKYETCLRKRLIFFRELISLPHSGNTYQILLLVGQILDPADELCA